MGNCLPRKKQDGGDQSVIRVATSNGGVMEFCAPTTVESITGQFPGHGIFRSHGLFWRPLQDSDVLLAGESYHLLPLLGEGTKAHVGHVRSNSAPPYLPGSSSYRMSFDSRGLSKRSAEEVVRKDGEFWKVKLAINTEQLMEILAEEGKTQELIESVRTVAKCGIGYGGFSDRWSCSSSKNAASSSKNGMFGF